MSLSENREIVDAAVEALSRSMADVYRGHDRWDERCQRGISDVLAAIEPFIPDPAVLVEALERIANEKGRSHGGGLPFARRVAIAALDQYKAQLSEEAR